MWAYIKDNKIEEIIARPKDMVIDDVRHSRRIFSAWTWDELNAIGIYTVEAGTQGDDRFEITSNPTYTYSASGKKVTTSYTTTDKSLVDETVGDITTLGLKSVAKNQAKTTAHGLIKRFGWLVQRVTMDSSATIPSAVTTYCAAIRTDCAAIITAIDGASNMTAFKALYVDTVDSDGEITEVNRINRWTDDTNVETYIR